MTWGGGFFSQWAILLLKGLATVGNKYDLNLHVEAMMEKLN